MGRRVTERNDWKAIDLEVTSVNMLIPNYRRYQGSPKRERRPEGRTLQRRQKGYGRRQK